MITRGMAVPNCLLGVLVCLAATGLTLSISVTSKENVQEYFLSLLLRNIGKNGTVNETTLANFFEKYSIQYPHEDEGKSVMTCLASATSKDNYTRCLSDTCLSPSDVYQLSGLSRNVTRTELSALSPIILELLQRPNCQMDQSRDRHGAREKPHIPPTSLESWGYSILSVTIINLCSLAGVVVLPFIHKTIYKKMLICMVAIAVGTLAGSSLLFLIPEALELTDPANLNNYVWKMMTVVMGIYIFFLIEHFLKMIMKHKQKNTKKVLGAADVYSSFKSKTPLRVEAKYKNVDRLPHTGGSCAASRPLDNSSSSSSEDLDQSNSNGAVIQADLNGKQNGIESKSHGNSHHGDQVAPVAWMIIFGDGVHNFIDGVSIGAAFTESILAGLSVSLAIFCEELPHELGDFAVLLNAGMRLKRAICYNFLSATMCYLGLIVGIILGENTAMHTWVFAFAGGMFLYISLVDMMPEMNSASESEENRKEIGARMIFILQNIGLCIGFGLMLCMAVFGDHIKFE